MKLASQLPPITGGEGDRVAGNHSRNNDFSVASAYEYLGNNNAHASARIWKNIWGWSEPQRIKTFLWLAASGKFLTNLERCRRHFTDMATCP